MSVATLFEQFRKNLAVRNEDAISTSYCQITKRLNKDYWSLDSEYVHCLQVGSYGRNTAIHGISDLDMVFELPSSVLERFKKVEGNGPSQLLQDVKQKLLARYPKTTIRGDGQVVVIEFTGFRVEVLPSFYNASDDSYTYGDTNNGGSWLKCKPRHEIKAVSEVNQRANRNLKRVCKMLRAWKDSQGAPMSGMLIDTLAYNFFKDCTDYDSRSYSSYPELVRDAFSFLANLPQQDYWMAPGSGQRVNSSGNFQRKAKKAAAKCQEAVDADTEKKKEKIWKEVFGTRFFPTAVVQRDFRESATYRETEEFIEDKFPMDIHYDLDIDCEITSNGQNEARLRFLMDRFQWLQLNRSLHFYVVSCNVPQPYGVLWKVRNVGDLAERKNQIRGEIVSDTGRSSKRETASFPGPHFVECYIVKDGY
ncbi:SMODS domain-containing nucleotidyltransferase, partial [Aurantimicrobium sp.]|uniref:SMODS domain-containing nucleotidyltransferase n=1 Tax=Aurantimicrobium sp. TaxID=1930784 RepID=UPI002FC9ED9F